MGDLITIIGANGFLSHSLQKFFSEAGYAIRIIGRTSSTVLPNSEFVKINCLTDEIPERFLMDSKVVIYCVGAGIQSNRVESLSSIYSLNLSTPAMIARNLCNWGYKGKLITFGSVFEIGDHTGQQKITEDEILNKNSMTNNDYILSKKGFSRFVNSYKPGFCHLHFILPSLYGPEEGDHRLIKYVFNSIRNEVKPSFTSGDQVRQYVLVDDIGPIIYRCICKDVCSGTYNIGNGEIYSVKDIVKLIYEKEGKTLPEDIWGQTTRRDENMKYLALDSSRLESMIGKIDFTSVQDGLKKYDNHYIDNVHVIDRNLISDDRGYFLKVMTGKESLLSSEFGEIYVTMGKPNEEKGGHYHPVALEWFTLIKGKADLILQDTVTHEIKTINMNASNPVTVFIPNNVAHVVRNTSCEDFILLAYTDRKYDPNDTITWKFD